MSLEWESRLSPEALLRDLFSPLESHLGFVVNKRRLGIHATERCQVTRSHEPRPRLVKSGSAKY